MRTKVLKAGFLLIVLLVTLVVLGGCGAKTAGQDTAAPQKAVVTDLAGRQVEVPVPANKVVAIGPGALRLVCYVNGADKVVGVENVENSGHPPAGRIFWPIPN
jgi:iron complex transport system substrate-binding protein